MAYKNPLISLIFIIILLVGCSNTPIESTQNDFDSTQILFGYPAIETETTKKEAFLSGYVAPKTTLSPGSLSNLSVSDPPESAAGFGSISGLLIDGNNNIVMTNTNIFLYHSSSVEDGKLPPVLVSSNPENGDISGITDNTGQFKFTNIPPGKYFLIVSIDLSPIYGSSAAAQPLLIEIGANSNINLGIVYYSFR